jgi:hypothetical protein
VRLVSDDRLLNLAEIFVGKDIALFASHYVSKPPFSGLPVLWHQDRATGHWIRCASHPVAGRRRGHD